MEKSLKKSFKNLVNEIQKEHTTQMVSGLAEIGVEYGPAFHDAKLDAVQGLQIAVEIIRGGTLHVFTPGDIQMQTVDGKVLTFHRGKPDGTSEIHNSHSLL